MILVVHSCEWSQRFVSISQQSGPAMARYVISPDFSDWFRRDSSVSPGSNTMASGSSLSSIRGTSVLDDVLVARGLEKIAVFLQRVAHDPAAADLVRNLGWPAPDGAKGKRGPSLGDTVVSFEAEPDEISAKRDEIDGILVEKAKLRWIEGLPPSGFVGIHSSAGYVPSRMLSGYSKRTLDVVIRGSSGPLPGVDVHAFWNGPAELSYAQTVTGGDGRASLEVPTGLTVTLEVVPPVDHWAVVAEVPSTQSDLELTCPLINLESKGLWWRDLVGGTSARLHRGAGVRIGIVDSGVGPHPALTHVKDGGAFGTGIVEARGNAEDLRGHGTHVAGVIGARGVGPIRWEGLAPDAELFSCRVFGPSGPTDQSTVADAILDLAQRGAHLVNLSLSASEASAIEKQSVRIARDLGTLCIAAAGNRGGKVQYPAAYPEVVAVGAIGRRGEWLPRTSSATRVPVIAEDWGKEGLFGANFSCRGKEVACVAPGVGVASTVADAVRGIAGHAVMDGTSMASPMVTGALAAVLSGDEVYVSMPATRDRSLRARRALKKLLAETGLKSENWGDGTPDLAKT
jgi:subtilisin